MKRHIYNELLKWKNSKKRKPLILSGCRQCGKTYVLQDFGKNEYTNVAYINCDNNPVMSTAFTDFDTNRLIRVFSALSNTRILPDETLIILDEIQQVPLALTSLKYFCENVPMYHIAVAGSLLGINMHEGTGFPVGKVDEMDLYPMSFAEFLEAYDRKELLNLLNTHHWEETIPFHDTLTDLLRQYYFVGGMPEAVQCYIDTQDLLATRKIQKSILNDYRRDFSKHISKETLPKVNLVWDAIPGQLAKENKKFIYSALRAGARAKEYENAIQWFLDAGLIYKATRVRNIEMPLHFYEDEDAFKLFFCDLGLFGAMNEAPASQILVGDNIFKQYNGAFSEQYFAQQLISLGKKAYYYSKENSTLKVDFVVQNKVLHPIEVKAETNLKSKSLKTVLETNPTVEGWRFSMSPYSKKGRITNVPLYLEDEWLSALIAE